MIAAPVQGMWLDLKKAVGNNDIQKAQEFINHGADVNFHDQYECTPLYYAIQCNHPEMVKLLLDYGADVNSKNSYYGSTMLHYALHYNYPEIVKLLLDYGADINCRNRYGYPPLHYTIEYGHMATVKLLLNHGADVNLKNIDEETPLHIATKNGYTEIVKLLLDYGADVNLNDKYECTALYHAVQIGNTEISKLLLDHGADVNLKNKYQETPLHIAAKDGLTKTVHQIITHNADTTTKDNQGHTAYDLAILYNNNALASDLLKITHWKQLHNANKALSLITPQSELSHDIQESLLDLIINTNHIITNMLLLSEIGTFLIKDQTNKNIEKHLFGNSDLYKLQDIYDFKKYILVKLVNEQRIQPLLVLLDQDWDISLTQEEKKDLKASLASTKYQHKQILLAVATARTKLVYNIKKNLKHNNSAYEDVIVIFNE